MKNKKTNTKKAAKTTKRWSKPWSRLRSEKAIKDIVKAEIHKNTEDKVATAQFGLTNFNSGINSIGDIVQILPQVAIGSNVQQRIGDKIKMKTLSLRGILRLTTIPTTTSYNYVPAMRIAVRVIVCQPKTVTNSTDVGNNQGAWLSRLLKNGNSSVAFDGTLTNLFLPTNTEVITKYYDKIYYMRQPAIINPGVSTLELPTETSSVKFLRFKLKAGKNRTLNYDQSFDTLKPTNFNPCILVGYSYIDGSSPDTVVTNVAMNFTSFLYFEDA